MDSARKIEKLTAILILAAVVQYSTMLEEPSEIVGASLPYVRPFLHVMGFAEDSLPRNYEAFLQILTLHLNPSLTDVLD